MKTIVIVLIAVLLAKNSNANVWTVDDDGNAQFTKIQDAIDAAGDGDTVFVYPGTYYENIDIGYKTIRLIGSGKDSTYILPSSSMLKMNLLAAHKEGFYICNFTLDANFTTEIGINIISNAVIKDNLIKNCKYAGIKVPFGTVHPNSIS